MTSTILRPVSLRSVLTPSNSTSHLPHQHRFLHISRQQFGSSTPRCSALAAHSSGSSAAKTTNSNLRHTQQQTRHQHAVSNPTLANIEKRWDEMPPQEQAELWMALRDRMTVDWHQMTMQEKRASYWIAFGPHGPRALPPPDQTYQVVKTVTIWVGAAVGAFFVIHSFARPPPKTMTKEWQEKSNEYLKRQRIEPITGISSEGYKGKGMVQSPPGLDKYENEEDE
ncbi:MAG: Cytochrome c oxidase subunit 5A [Alyxoria varia]|nr:MAG: Cytochrome c oxidase subunit 5A [Alyxoria varia]